MSLLLVVTLVVSGVLVFIAGFHDVSNSIATAVRTHALSPSIAVLVAALFNGFGCVAGATLGSTVADWLTMPDGPFGLGVLLSGVLAACCWGLVTYWWSMPSSTTHALVSGLVGASLATVLLGHEALDGIDGQFWPSVVLPLLVTPVAAFALSFGAVAVFGFLDRHEEVRFLSARNRAALAVGAAVVALGHGMQTGLRSITVMTAALITAGVVDRDGGPVGTVVAAVALIGAAGCLTGGWRITHTLGYRLVRLDPLRAMVTQWISAVMMFGGTTVLDVPVSSSQTVAAGLLGTAANHRFVAINRPLATRIVGVWILTVPACLLLGMVLTLALDPLVALAH
ncbi:inorganic phosphate transporter [Tersicoccus solisilvae]|uniref:Inorganic phosphate transporter n=1 Tax=Tersicoccus solisilvae TaxID=1882339 RepID=A0ABQ1PA56_9MICC|nr:inorganic phosphate transporter [Tersicoccus solisilvae]GGC93825.1 inorganic phosphate transporter [Tersicoccus solisilvae]